MPHLFSNPLCKSCLATIAVTFISGAVAVQAQTQTYSDRTTFTNNTTVTTNVTFEGLAPDMGFDYLSSKYPDELVEPGVTFGTGPGFNTGFLSVAGKGSYFPGTSVLDIQGGYASGFPPQAAENELVVTFNTPVTAIGFDFGNPFYLPAGSSRSLNFQLSDGETFTRAVEGTNAYNDNFTFFGITANAPITSIIISDDPNFMGPLGGQDNSINIDNFTFGVAAVPEASTTFSFGLLLALGPGSAIVAARKKKASTSV